MHGVKFIRLAKDHNRDEKTWKTFTEILFWLILVQYVIFTSGQCYKTFNAVFYGNSMVIHVIKLFYLGNYYGMAVNYQDMFYHIGPR